MAYKPSLTQLRYLIAVVREEHFGRAAEACFVAQPSLSSGLKELEDGLGVRLIERTKRKVVVTPLGADLAKRAEAILARVNGLVEAAQTARSPLTGELRLGVIPTIAPYLLPKIMAPLRDAFPDLKLLLREDQTERLLEDLTAGKQDALILALPWPLEAARSQVFGQDRFFVAFPQGHRFSGLKEVPREAVAEENLLLLEDGHCLRDHALSACSLPPSMGTQGVQGTSLTTLVQMAANGYGITLLPEMSIDSGLLAGTGLQVRPLAGETHSISRDIGLVWRNTSGRTAEFQQFTTFLGQTIIQS